MQTAHTYLMVRAIGAPLNSSLLVLQAACRGMGNAGLSLRAAVVANIANLALDPLLIFGLSFGVRGAALATVTGQVQLPSNNQAYCLYLCMIWGETMWVCLWACATMALREQYFRA